MLRQSRQNTSLTSSRSVSVLPSPDVKHQELTATTSVVKHVPAWMPGAGWKRKAVKWRTLMQEAKNRPYDMLQEQIVRFCSPMLVR